ASSILTDTYYNITGGIVELDGDIIGTGPFVFDSYEEDVEIVMHVFNNYWRGKAQIEMLIFVQIISEDLRSKAFLAGDIQFLKDPMPEWVDALKFYPDITVVGKQSGGIQYLVINNVLINRTWREAISYAFNYTYVIEEIRHGHAERLKSPIGVGIKYYNGSVPVPTTNLTKARLIMQSMGFGVAFNVSEDDEWLTLAASSPFRSLNYSYDFGNDVREAIFLMLIRNLAKIGIRVTDAGSTWSIVLDKIYEQNGHHRNELELLFIGWDPDYNDPSNFINPLFTNRSIAFNAAQYNGYTEAIEAGRDPLDLWDNVQLLMEQALITPDGPVREAMYDRIQELLIADFALCWAEVPNLIYAFYDDLTGFQQNFFDTLYFYPCQWNSGNNARSKEEFPSEMIFISFLLICIGIVLVIAIHNWFKRKI
ncbi:MAG: ABC transporter substrate-binding protein, partial [Promethearchaeota archaeon]